MDFAHAAHEMPPAFESQLVDGCIVVLRFASADAMNRLLDPISDRVDGPIRNRQGHNFPYSMLTEEELRRVVPKDMQKACRYVIACVKGNAQVGGWRAWAWRRNVSSMRALVTSDE